MSFGTGAPVKKEKEKFVPLTKDDISYLMKLESLTQEQVKEFFLKNSSGFYFIKRAGLLYKMEKRYSGNFSIVIESVREDEYKNILRMLALPDKGEPFVIMKAVIRIKDSGIEFVDYGSASMTNTVASRYLIEMASTRASNRAMRLATVSAFTTDAEVVYETDIPSTEPVEPQTENKPPVEKKAEPKKESKKKAKVDEGVKMDRDEMIKSIKSIQQDYGYSDLQINKSLIKLFGEENLTLESLPEDRLMKVYEKMLSLKAA